MMPNPKTTLIKLAFHRNGISGLGFHVGIILHDDEEMLVIRFDKSADADTGNVICVAFNLPKLTAGIIESGENSYRGDYFAPIIDKYIEQESAR